MMFFFVLVRGRTTIMDSSKQASEIFEQAVANRSLSREVVNRMCQIFTLLNFSVKSFYFREKCFTFLNIKGELFRIVKFESIASLEASMR